MFSLEFIKGKGFIVGGNNNKNIFIFYIRILRRHAVEKKYGKKQKTDTSLETKVNIPEVPIKEDTGKSK